MWLSAPQQRLTSWNPTAFEATHVSIKLLHLEKNGRKKLLKFTLGFLLLEFWSMGSLFLCEKSGNREDASVLLSKKADTEGERI